MFFSKLSISKPQVGMGKWGMVHVPTFLPLLWLEIYPTTLQPLWEFCKQGQFPALPRNPQPFFLFEKLHPDVEHFDYFIAVEYKGSRIGWSECLFVQSE